MAEVYVGGDVQVYFEADVMHNMAYRFFDLML